MNFNTIVITKQTHSHFVLHNCLLLTVKKHIDSLQIDITTVNLVLKYFYYYYIVEELSIKKSIIDST